MLGACSLRKVGILTCMNTVFEDICSNQGYLTKNRHFDLTVTTKNMVSVGETQNISKMVQSQALFFFFFGFCLFVFFCLFVWVFLVFFFFFFFLFL